jgi:hypothetical protein
MRLTAGRSDNSRRPPYCGWAFGDAAPHRPRIGRSGRRRAAAGRGQQPGCARCPVAVCRPVAGAVRWSGSPRRAGRVAGGGQRPWCAGDGFRVGVRVWCAGLDVPGVRSAGCRRVAGGSGWGVIRAGWPVCGGGRHTIGRVAGRGWRNGRRHRVVIPTGQPVGPPAGDVAGNGRRRRVVIPTGPASRAAARGLSRGSGNAGPARVVTFAARPQQQPPAKDCGRAVAFFPPFFLRGGAGPVPGDGAIPPLSFVVC